MVTFFNIVYRYFKLTPGDVAESPYGFSPHSPAFARGKFL